jgi:hypothetical protein
MQPARAAYCIANNPRTVQRSAAHCIATSSQRIGPRIASRASHPSTTSPVSLTNLQVAVGGQNVLQSTLQYGYEHFLEQVNLAEQLTSSDFGISTGLINQNYWENSKWYWVNVERGSAGDKLSGRNINVSFINNSNVPIEVMIFIFYSDEIAIDVTTGLVTRHKN